MKLALIGCSDHWRSYAAALKDLPDLQVSAVATASPDEPLSRFDDAPGVTQDTTRFTSPADLLASSPDAVQVSTRADLIGTWVMASLERGIPALAEKPFAFSLEELALLRQVAQRTGVPVSAMHGQRATPLIARVHQLVHSGAIGTPLLAHNQKSYRWGSSRPHAYKDRATFPGTAAWIGIHAFDWLLWILGDRFASVTAHGSNSAHPDYPAVESQSGYLFHLTGDGMATVNVDYLRPEAAPTHGDERIRIAGTDGVVEISTGYNWGTLIDKSGVHELTGAPSRPWFAEWLRRAVLQENPPEPPLHPQWEIFRATEIALTAQRALETNQTLHLRDTPYTPASFPSR
ncbi:MAG TPA: Gfo/Idh/MocA family oxidoreductase [Chloroflexota bacterium]|jgi:predicted dehydrogenase|nr:Gfo/Idh/MocA family oxidoreductase [Chloroflexota bacterium]